MSAPVPPGTEWTVVNLLLLYREARGQGADGWIDPPDYALVDLQKLLATGHAECRGKQWRPTALAQKAAEEGVIRP